MKKLNDEEIQRLLERGEEDPQVELSPEQAKEIETYRVLFSALKEELPNSLSYNFAAKVAEQVQAKTRRKIALTSYLLAITLIIGGFVSFYFAISNFQKGFTVQLINAISPYRWILIFFLSSLFVIQFLDQKFVKKF